jgi:hypothetical protein
MGNPESSTPYPEVQETKLWQAAEKVSGECKTSHKSAKSATYTSVHEYFAPVSGAILCRTRVYQQLVKV